MPANTAAPWSIIYALPVDEIKAFPAEVDQVKAERIAKIFGERLPIYKAYAAGATLKTGEWADQTKSGETFTMPAVGTANQSIVTSSSVAEAKLTTAAKFVGGGLSSSTAILTTGMVAVWQSDGTNWRLIAGEVKREEKFAAQVGRVSGTEYEPSTTRPVEVFIVAALGQGFTALKVGGTELMVAGASAQAAAVTFRCNPGEKFAATTSSGEYKSCYRAT